MVEILKEGWTKEITCPYCEAELRYKLGDIKVTSEKKLFCTFESIWDEDDNEYEWQTIFDRFLVCPSCQRKIRDASFK